MDAGAVGIFNPNVLLLLCMSAKLLPSWRHKTAINKTITISVWIWSRSVYIKQKIGFNIINVDLKLVTIPTSGYSVFH